ncbi:hypothetical protein J4E85_009386 [Alternaria conjuncta]|uniref:uncharacterized protein n=1 Tax=Alternaria conjuncta TaxID=181017 RepID=UPI00221EFB24|nr:uncharacterized protein J4E85_009386 [Alternaria conjuncta]KAI4919129.1 hypothetical protein J4E85_009386 [Alternaria conjuncta]
MADRTPAPRKRATPKSTGAEDAQGRLLVSMLFQVYLSHEEDSFTKYNEFMDAVKEAEGAEIFYKVDAGYPDPLKELVDFDTFVDFGEYKEYKETAEPTVPALE